MSYLEPSSDSQLSLLLSSLLEPLKLLRPGASAPVMRPESSLLLGPVFLLFNSAVTPGEFPSSGLGLWGCMSWGFLCGQLGPGHFTNLWASCLTPSQFHYDWAHCWTSHFLSDKLTIFIKSINLLCINNFLDFDCIYIFFPSLGLNHFLVFYILFL